ncbi:MAG: RNA 2',3'-cyclic phosphodiesterase [Geminicoccaceae bacterium]|nr:RNA 2',3'-cyclic phosphodiesterase [Geminicoccaceae bacterium]
MPRLFVAIDLPDDVKLSLNPLTRGLGDVRWLDEDQQHLTLRFIGEVDNGGLDDVVEALTLVDGSAFELRLEGIGHFPPRGEPRVIWAGVTKSEPLRRLKRSVDRALDGIGHPSEGRKFAPHVTLARLRRPPPPYRLASWLAAHSLYRSEPFLVRGFHLYSSWLRPEGAEYMLEAGYELHPASGPVSSG